ncbi:OprO/OprP family phosphate-selective porin [Flavobacteriaceae bacterium F89]|uniref:OprO/OprP family phosphate-selective porin n=1 Tax=Cerina litoralis TaxID=2874477 RepID=A0AAE3EXV9_9FLAO|nr:porin [Cerina litoralis]MCG2461771.1 OprO/OprP family phosphate-selective porin [Cerina litoralis]
MIRHTIFVIALLLSTFLMGQVPQDSTLANPQYQQSTAQRILTNTKGNPLTLGGYGEVKYRQPIGANGELDVHRLVLMLGYRFNDKVQFFSEIEFEHAEKVEVEQAFVNYNVANNFNLRAGLMLVPMGIINLYHEPTTFNGVDRPGVDKYIVPTTWREIGIGFSGKINSVSLSYEAYLFNGIKSIEADGTGLIGGSSGLRNGRQNGGKATMDKPNLSMKADYYGLPGLKLGLAGYFGRTEAPDDIRNVPGADVGVAMVGLDARYVYNRFSARGELIYTALNDTEAYNDLTGQDLGSALFGWYTEAAYNLMPQKNKQKLDAFVRYEQYDTNAKTAGTLVANDAYNRNDVTLGLSYHITPGVVFKGDYRIYDNAVENNDLKNQVNFGVGVWF